jgi:hypothetical protein
MMAVFSEFIEEIVEVFMDDFSAYGKLLRIVWQTWIKFLQGVGRLTWCLIGRNVISW